MSHLCSRSSRVLLRMENEPQARRPYASYWPWMNEGKRVIGSWFVISSDVAGCCHGTESLNRQSGYKWGVQVDQWRWSSDGVCV